MVTYIYFVKCPNCEDEHFDFFDEAKDFAMGCLSQKPVITQTEVHRNDFGECTDSADLGTVWSWEDMMGEGGYTEAEPTNSIFTKDDLKLMADAGDPEFDELDNSVDFEPEIPEVSSTERKPIPEGMSIKDLVEEMEENEDTVECTWCEDLFDKSECHYEVDLGWLCSRCEATIKSRGETLTFRENNYWDFLDEDVNEAEVETLHDLGNEYDGGYPAEGSKLAELEDADEYSKRLTTCPECGEKSFDHETGFCLECGFTTLTEDISEQTFASVNKDIEEIKDDLIKLADNQQVIGKGLSVAFDNMEKQHKIILDKLDK